MKRDDLTADRNTIANKIFEIQRTAQAEETQRAMGSKGTIGVAELQRQIQ